MKKRVLAVVLAVLITLMIFPTHLFAQTQTASGQNAFFNDVSTDYWAANVLNRWAVKGLISGYGDKTFRPDSNITRAEFIFLIDRVIGYQIKASKDFDDVKSMNWYYNSVNRARNAGIISGYNNRFSPNLPVSKQDAAVIVSKAFELQVKENSKIVTFRDNSDIAPYAMKDLSLLVQEGHLTISDNNAIQPMKNLTRAEAIVLIDSLAGDIINKAGEYSLGALNGNLVINTPDVTLKNTIVKGDLYLAPGIMNGDVTLDGVTVNGTVYVSGGGSNSVRVINSTLPIVIIDKDGDQGVRILASGSTVIASTFIKSEAKLEESGLSGEGFKGVTLDKELPKGRLVEFTGNFDQVDVQARGAVLKTEKAVMILIVLTDEVDVNGKEVKKATTYAVYEDGKVTEPTPPSSTSSTSSTSNTNPPANDWNLVWQDEFNGSLLNMNNWSYDVPTNGRYNGEIQSYTQNNATVENGSLIIEARKEDITEPSNETYHYSSGKLITKGKQSWKYGKLEIKAKMPAGKGIWPAIWMMPEDEDFYGTWPKCGEIDIMELLGDSPQKIHGTIHYGEPHKESQGTYILSGDRSFADDYHTYAIEWEPGEIRWYIDGNLYHTANDWFSNDPKEADDYTYPAPFDQNFFLILNISVGGGWPGNPDDTTEFPQQMAVDYVRVYQKDSYPVHEKPIKQELTAREPLADGNYIYNGSFNADVPNVAGIEGIVNSAYWTFLQGPNGNTSIAIEDGVLHAQITNGGTADYSVQVLQAPVLLEKGAKYKASFKAKAADNRSIKLKIGSDGDSGWKDYAKIPRIDLTTDMTEYAFEFTMDDKTDLKARYEFNMGLSNHDVWITDVKLIKTENAPVVDPSAAARPVLPTGNYIYNGTFDQGVNRMAYWNFTTDQTASAIAYIGSAVNERRFETIILNGGSSAEAVNLVQSGLYIEKGKTYTISFDASAKQARTIEVNVKSNGSNSNIHTETITLDTSSKEYSFTFMMAQDTDKNSELQFNLGGNPFDVTIDNVFMKKEITGDVEGNLLYNGIFDSLEFWHCEAYDPAEASFENAGGNQLKAAITSVGTAGWQVQLYQDGVRIEKGETYEVSFDAKSDTDRMVVAQIQHNGSSDDNWTSYFQENVTLTDELTTYTYTFTMGNDTDAASRFSFALGNTESKALDNHEVVIDNVVVKKVVPPVIPSTELILNGTFDSDYASWQEYWGGSWEDSSDGAGDGTAEGTITVENGELKVDITTLGNKDYIPQLKQGNLTLEEGVTYIVSLKARAETSRTIKIDVLDSSYNWYGGTQCDLTDKDATYTFEFTPDKNRTDGTLCINFGPIADKPSMATKIYLDDISITKK